MLLFSDLSDNMPDIKFPTDFEVGVLSYQPDVFFTGLDDFTYLVNDGEEKNSV